MVGITKLRLVSGIKSVAVHGLLLILTAVFRLGECAPNVLVRTETRGGEKLALEARGWLNALSRPAKLPRFPSRTLRPQ